MDEILNQVITLRDLLYMAGGIFFYHLLKASWSILKNVYKEYKK